MNGTEPQPHRLRIVTFEPTPEPVTCTGSYACPCPACHLEREQAIARGVRPRKPQPWDTRRAA